MPPAAPSCGSVARARGPRPAVGFACQQPRADHGVAVANEVLDAFLAHILARTAEGVREVFVGEESGCAPEAAARRSRHGSMRMGSARSRSCASRRARRTGACASSAPRASRARHGILEDFGL